MNQTPLLPITADSGIVSTYVNIKPQDSFFTLLTTEKEITVSAAANEIDVKSFQKKLVSDEYSRRYVVVTNLLYQRGLLDSTTAIDSYSGTLSSTNYVLSIYKQNLGDQIVSGSLSANYEFVPKKYYYSNTANEILLSGDSTNRVIGNYLPDEGMISITGVKSSDNEKYGLIQNQSVKFKTIVYQNTLNVFCRCQPNELNFSLNPTAFESDSVGNWMSEPFTASTSASRFRSDFTSSGIDWQPIITSIGLYNDDNELLAIAKLSKPLRKSAKLPMTFHVRIDT